MSGKRFLAIVNPRGGARQGLAVAEIVHPVFRRDGAELDIHLTERAEHATELVRTMDLAPYDGLCVIGGDGTTHEVVNGLMQRSDGLRIPLGLIPAGTGNTLHRHLQGGQPLEAAERIVRSQVHPLDVVRVTMERETAYCINIVGWGAVVDINSRAEKLRVLGKVRYSVATLIQILMPKPRRATIVLDDDTVDDEFLFILACNTKYTGAGMFVAPRAEVDDGILDVVLLRNTTRWQAIKLFTKVFDGSHLELPGVEYRQVRSLAVTPAESGPLILDGEAKGNAPLIAEVMAGALHVFR